MLVVAVIDVDVTKSNYCDYSTSGAQVSLPPTQRLHQLSRHLSLKHVRLSHFSTGCLGHASFHFGALYHKGGFLLLHNLLWTEDGWNLLRKRAVWKFNATPMCWSVFVWIFFGRSAPFTPLSYVCCQRGVAVCHQTAVSLCKSSMRSGPAKSSATLTR